MCGLSVITFRRNNTPMTQAVKCEVLRDKWDNLSKKHIGVHVNHFHSDNFFVRRSLPWLNERSPAPQATLQVNTKKIGEE